VSDFVRVKHPLFGEYSTRRPTVEVEVIDKPAVDASGRPLPAKPKTSVATKAAASKSPTGGEPATKNPEEGSK
jgi:hypothetical protein